MKIKSLILWAAAIAVVLMLASCSSRRTVVFGSGGKTVGNGPPAHAPAHGRRRKMPPANVEVVFDSDCGVYVVVGLEKHFWLDGHYYRFINGSWQVSVSIDSGWAAVGERALPPGLRKKYKGWQASDGRPGRGWGVAKKKW
jgi:hypothetical protein